VASMGDEREECVRPGGFHGFSAGD
jgi:hypothetical protein